MFLFLNDELDFRQLSEMAQTVERYRSTTTAPDQEEEKSTGGRQLNVRDMYGFIRPEQPETTIPAASNDGGDDFDERMRDRRSDEGRVNHPVRHRKQDTLKTDIDPSSS